MTTSDALFLIKLYGRALANVGNRDTTLTDLAARFPPTGSEQKAMRWLGFIQGACYVLKIYTVDELAQHTRLLLAKDYARLNKEIR